MNPQYTNVKVDSLIPYFSGQPANGFQSYFCFQTGSRLAAKQAKHQG